MHGLALRSIQLFVTDCYGLDTWEQVLIAACFEDDEFEPMLDYSDETADALIDALATTLGRPQSEFLEDLGTYLVTNPKTEALRRLLRFCGVTFEDFLYSLNDLPDRVKLAVPDFELPRIDLREHSTRQYSLICTGRTNGFGHVLMGILRTMADDYGALAIVEHRGGGLGVEVLSVSLLEATYAEGRDFALGGQVA
ncbi:MAG: heme NO-binding domain-containing protein [Paracoccaceae bacterium]